MKVSNKVLVDFGKFEVPMHRPSAELFLNNPEDPEVIWICYEIKRGAAPTPAMLICHVADCLLNPPDYENYEGRKAPKFSDLDKQKLLRLARLLIKG